MFGTTGSRKRNISTSTSTQLFTEAFTRSSKHKAHKTDHQVPCRKRAQAPWRLLALYFVLKIVYFSLWRQGLITGLLSKHEAQKEDWWQHMSTGLPLESCFYIADVQLLTTAPPRVFVKSKNLLLFVHFLSYHLSMTLNLPSKKALRMSNFKACIYNHTWLILSHGILKPASVCFNLLLKAIQSSTLPDISASNTL